MIYTIEHLRVWERDLRANGDFDCADDLRNLADAQEAGLPHFERHDICGSCGRQRETVTDRYGGVCDECEELQDEEAWYEAQQARSGADV